MTARVVGPTFVGDAIVVDEVGLESGVYGRYRLRSSYQPIFERRGAELFPTAVEGRISPYLAGRPAAIDAFLADVPAGDTLFVENMCRALHLRNHHNIGVDRLELFFNYDPPANADLEKSLDEIRLMARGLAEIELDPMLLVCEIAQTVALDAAVLAELAAEMRRHGARVAIDDFGAGHSTLERVNLVKPEIVKIDGAWFRKVCLEAAAIKLLKSLVAGFRQRGAKVLIQGIEEAAHLGHALSTGAELLQGFYLAPPALVGTAFDAEPLQVADKLGAEPNVVPLFA